MQGITKQFVAAITAIATLGGCVQTRQLYAIRQYQTPRLAKDDRPRVDYASREVKASFVKFVQDNCGIAPAAAAKAADDAPWGKRNVAASACVQRVAAYAVDQCALITLHQNEVAAAANATLGIITAFSGLAVAGYVVRGKSTDADRTTAVLAGETAASNLKGFLPSNTTTPVKDMLDAAPSYAEAIGLTDHDFASSFGDPGASGTSMKLARVHDAVFSMCAANAYGGEVSPIGGGRLR